MITWIICQLIGLSLGCSRSDGLASERIDCGLGIRVIFDSDIHCVFAETDLSDGDECPGPTEFKYLLAGAAICSTNNDLSTPELGFIYNSAWPPERDSSERLDAGGDEGLRFQDLDSQ